MADVAVYRPRGRDVEDPPPEEGRALVAELQAFAQQHRAAGFDDSLYTRTMYRIMLEGDPPIMAAAPVVSDSCAEVQRRHL